jgi:F-type H+-transporting ATPase subunit delta
MAQLITQARPYARAAYEHAKAHQQVDSWLTLLQTAAAFMLHAEVVNYIMNPKVSNEKAVTFFKEVLANVSEPQENFLKLLAADKQLNLLPDVATLFTAMYEQDGDIVAVKVIAAAELSEQQKENICRVLETRLQKKVKLHCAVDSQLMGGAVIQTPEWVLDGSVKGKLQQLKTKLVG